MTMITRSQRTGTNQEEEEEFQPRERRRIEPALTTVRRLAREKPLSRRFNAALRRSRRRAIGTLREQQRERERKGTFSLRIDSLSRRRFLNPREELPRDDQRSLPSRWDRKVKARCPSSINAFACSRRWYWTRRWSLNTRISKFLVRPLLSLFFPSFYLRFCRRVWRNGLILHRWISLREDFPRKQFDRRSL